MSPDPTRPRPSVTIVMPAYNAAATLEATLNDIPAGCCDAILVGDDCSQDDTVAVAERLGLTTLRTPRNLGYGGNQKMLYRAALDRGADIVVMLHPDNQYDARLIPYFVGFLASGTCDVILGNRIRSRRECLGGGMPWWKYASNRALTILLNLVFGTNEGEFHSGFRAYRREVLEKIPFDRNGDGFGFDIQFLAQTVAAGFKLASAPMPVRYFEEASSIRFWPSVRYGLDNLRVAALFLLYRIGLRSSLFRGEVSPPRASESR